MNSFNIAFKLFRNNIRIYGYYCAVMVFAVAIYYNFTALKHNPQALVIQDLSRKAETAAQMNSVVLIVFLAFFMWYSSAFFLKQRKKEIGIYSMAGISSGKIGLVIAIESILIGIVAVVSGLLLGILLSKLFLMVLARVSLLEVTVAFSIPIKAIRELIITFGIIFLALSVRTYISVARSKLIDLLSDFRKDEGEPKFKMVRGILAIIFIGTGYYLSGAQLGNMDFMSASLLILILVIMGTYWFFGGFISLVMKFLIGKKGILYKGVNILGINNIAYRLKGNYRSLAMLAILVATTITAFGTSLSLKYYIDNTHGIQYPYTFSYISGDASLSSKVTETINSSKHKLLLKEQISLLRIQPVEIKDVMYSHDNVLGVRYSDFERISADLKVKNIEELLKKAKPSEGQLTFIKAPGTLINPMNYKNKKILLDGEQFNIQEELMTPIFGEGELGKLPCIVLSDEVYDQFRKKFEEHSFNGFLTTEPVKTEELAISLMQFVPKDTGFFPYVKHFRSTYAWIGLFFSLGAFMSVVFILATGSIMYFKLLSEALADKGKYEILSKIGMSKLEIRRAVSFQVGLSLILPLVIGIIHSFFAINVLEGILHYNLSIPTIKASAVFALTYMVFYAVTTRKFLKLVTA